MACPPEVMARLGCARIILSRNKGGAQHETVSRLQADAVIDLMKRQGPAIGALDPEVRARVAALATAGEWYSADLARILTLLVPPKPKDAKTRSDMQTYTPSILHYFTASEWSGMEGQGVASAMDLLITRLLQLGAKCLSEPCKAWCSSLLLSLNGMGRCTEHTKQHVHAVFKAEYRRRARRHKKANAFSGVSFLKLPSAFKEEHPDVHAEIFGCDDPVPSNIDFDTIQITGVFCRFTHKRSIQMGGLAALEDREGGGQAGVQIQLMQQLVSMQSDNLQLLRDSVRPGPTPSSLLALTSQPPPRPQGSVVGRLALPAEPPQSQPLLDSLTEDSQDAADGAAGGEPSPQAHIGGPMSSDDVGGPMSSDRCLEGGQQLASILDTGIFDTEESQVSLGQDSLSDVQFPPLPPRSDVQLAPLPFLSDVQRAPLPSSTPSPSNVQLVPLPSPSDLQLAPLPSSSDVQLAPLPSPSMAIVPAAAGPALALQIMGEM